MAIYISSSCSRKLSVFDAVEELAAIGFTHIELSGGTCRDEYSCEALLSLRDRLGLTFLVHNYFPPPSEDFVLNLATADEADKHRALALIREALSLSLELGQSHYGVHAGYMHEMSLHRDANGVFKGTQSIANARQLQETFVAEIIDMLPSGLKLALENAFPHSPGDDTPVMCSPDHIDDFLVKYEHGPVGLLLDMGHLGVSACMLEFDKFAYLRMLLPLWGSRIFEVHLSTHDGARDAHNITHPDSADVAFLQEHLVFWKHAPLVLEWQNVDCREAYAAYEKLTPLLAV